MYWSHSDWWQWSNNIQYFNMLWIVYTNIDNRDKHCIRQQIHQAYLSSHVCGVLCVLLRPSSSPASGQHTTPCWCLSPAQRWTQCRRQTGDLFKDKTNYGCSSCSFRWSFKPAAAVNSLVSLYQLDSMWRTWAVKSPICTCSSDISRVFQVLNSVMLASTCPLTYCRLWVTHGWLSALPTHTTGVKSFCTPGISAATAPSWSKAEQQAEKWLLWTTIGVRTVGENVFSDQPEGLWFTMCEVLFQRSAVPRRPAPS